MASMSTRVSILSARCFPAVKSSTSRERPKPAPYLRLKKTRKPLFLQLETTKALEKLKIEEKKFPIFLKFFFEVSGKSHSAENVKGGTFFLMLDALDALKMKY